MFKSLLITADKQVFPKLDIVGWYATGEEIGDDDMAVHRKVPSCWVCHIWHDLTVKTKLCIATVCRSWSSMNPLFSCSSTPNKASSEKIFLCRCTRAVSWLCTYPGPASHVQTSAAAPMLCIHFMCRSKLTRVILFYLPQQPNRLHTVIAHRHVSKRHRQESLQGLCLLRQILHGSVVQPHHHIQLKTSLICC